MTTARWSKAGAMTLLARLYLNSDVYTGVDKYADCAKVCQDIIDNKYGSYDLAQTWDEPFDWNNDKSKETIFAFPSSLGRTHWQYESGMYWWSLPFKIKDYLGFTEFGDANPKFGMQPGLDLNGNKYNFADQLGQPYVNFQKYTDDLRLKKYKNTGTNQREGMFLFGYLEYNGNQRVKADNGKDLYIRDQVGVFGDLGPGQNPDDKTSTMATGDQNSGIFHVKYPIYKDDDEGSIESDYAEVRMAEVYYMLAECKLRKGESGVASILNSVRKRNYPAGSTSLYASDAEITEAEMLAEWGREFFAEGRRRTDLIRFDKFTKGRWWDKEPDASEHLKIFPISFDNLKLARQLKQNPGYEDIQ
jgi:hypothetical protein